MNPRIRGDRGDATTEMVLTVPALMLVVFLIIQFGVWYHANNVAEAAAQEGVRAARVMDGTAAAGQTTAASFMARNAPGAVTGTVVSVTRNTNITQVDITATLAAIIPGIHLPVHATAVSPVERFRPPR